MKTLKNKFAVLIIMIFAISCNSDDGDEVVTPPVTVKDVYVAGYETISSNAVAKYWKNGIGTALSDGVNYALATSIFVDGDDIYVSGYEYIGTNSVAKYWKNGTSFNLTNGSTLAAASSIFVSNGDVYVCGQEQSGDKFIAKYWKNGMPHNLSDGTKSSYTESIFVSGSDVYICGIQHSDVNSNTTAKYWKNGIATNLTNEGYNCSARSILLSGNDLYVVGSEGNDVKYWKNGSAVTVAPVPSGSSFQRGHGIAVVGSDVFVAGMEETAGPPHAKMWKNATPITLNTYGQANDIAVSPAGDIYMAGKSSSAAIAWKNDVPTALSSGTSTNSEALDVFLTYN